MIKTNLPFKDGMIEISPHLLQVLHLLHCKAFADNLEASPLHLTLAQRHIGKETSRQGYSLYVLHLLATGRSDVVLVEDFVMGRQRCQYFNKPFRVGATLLADIDRRELVGRSMRQELVEEDILLRRRWTRLDAHLRDFEAPVLAGDDLHEVLLGTRVGLCRWHIKTVTNGQTVQVLLVHHVLGEVSRGEEILLLLHECDLYSD